jgi:glycosyltransferase involved in cell wall biosynthesis
MNKNEQPNPQICVAIPTYNNAPTIGNVVKNISEHTSDIIVINDGSTDDTADVLSGFDGLEILTHDKNRGKGEALKTAFSHAAEKGFTHAVIMDADGQHLAGDLPKFFEAVRENPDALIIGVRDLAGRGKRLKSRILRANSNFWAWALTGRRLRDTQSGFRAYPLEKINALRLKTKKYDFEIESLVKAAWADVPVIEVPVGVEYPEDGVSHFRPLRDFLLVAHLNACLFFQCIFIPAPARKVMHLKSEFRGSFFKHLRWVVGRVIAHETSSPTRFSLSMGLGVFFGILPIWGFQMAAAVLAAHLLRLSKGVALAMSNVSFPAAIPFILYASLVIGRFALYGNLDFTFHFDVTALNKKIVFKYFYEYLVGSVIFAVCAGLATAIITFLLTASFRLLRPSKS